MNDSISIKCNKITVDNKYNKVLSKSVTMTDVNKSANFEFAIYDNEGDEILFNFTVSLILDEDDGESRFHYKATGDNISITLYNATPNQSSDYTTFCSKRKFITVMDSVNFYIMPKVTIYSNNFKDIYIDIYSEEI